MAESAFVVAEGISKRLVSLSLQGIGLLPDLKSEIAKLEYAVSTIKALLADAEEAEDHSRHQQVKDWLLKLREVLYHAEDLLDEFSYGVLRRRQDMAATACGYLTQKVRLFFSSTNDFKMRREIKAIRKKLEEVAAEGGSFYSDEDSPMKTTKKEAATMISEEKEQQTLSFSPQVVVGREDDRNKIVKLLLSSNYEQNIAVIPIVGLEGLGKTTLAQLVYDDAFVTSTFELRMWVCVSDDFSLELMVERILECLTNERPTIGDTDTLIDFLRRKINGKKYLLVLDDVWNEDSEKWSEFQNLLAGGAKGSRMILTTRSLRVAKMTGTVLPYELVGLSLEESWYLFRKVAFKQGCATQSRPNHMQNAKQEIGKEITKKCKGIPLAIKAIGGMLYSKETISEWECLLDNLEREEIGPLGLLKLSYDHLPSHLKLCFSYCSLFPKGHEIDVETLILLWIAQGYVRTSEKSQCLEDIALGYFKDLLWRSFFMDVVNDEFGNIRICKMHDLMHELALFVAGHETAFSLSSNIDERTQHVSLTFDLVSFCQVPSSLLKAKNLRTLLLSSYEPGCKLDEGQCDAIFSNLRRLRVLDLHGFQINTMPRAIGNLKCLRYLDFSYNESIYILPKSITRLQNLEVLRLQFCDGLKQLPCDIDNLVNLRHLDIDGCGALTHMPRGIGRLTSFQKLTRFILPKDGSVSKQSAGLSELHGLNNLEGRLQIENLGLGNNTTHEINAANLIQKKFLQVLVLIWDEGDGEYDIRDDEKTLEALQPHSNLKELVVQCYRGVRFPSWLPSLTNLVSITIRNCKNCQRLPPLDQIPSLNKLIVSGLTELEYIESSIDWSTKGGSELFFPSLKNLFLFNCPILKGWWWSGAQGETSTLPLNPQFHCLSDLFVHSCPDLISMPEIPSLEKLGVVSAHFASLKQISRSHLPSSSSSPATTKRPLKYLYIQKIEDLEYVPEELLQSLTFLEELYIWDCPRIRSLSHAMQHLTSIQTLSIGSCEELDLTDGNGMAWQSLRSLAILHIDAVPNLVRLPNGLQHATSLHTLDINNCPNLEALPEWMSNLVSLQYLCIKECPMLSESCKKDTGKDWPKVAHIPNVEII